MNRLETPRLAETQSFFARVIQRPVPVDAQPEATIAPRLVSGNQRLSPTAQLEIYREQFWLRHVDALEEDFATVVQLLGHDEFHRLVEAYLHAYPPHAFSLRDLGASFSKFLEETAPYSEDPLLIDCARLEWAFVEAFDAADAAPLEVEAIAAVPEALWPGARLTFHPSLQRVSLGHAAHEYRAAVRRGESPPRPLPAPLCVAVYRGPETLLYVAVEALAAELLERLMRGEPLGDACEAVATTVTDGNGAEIIEAKIGQFFQFWAASGWLTAIAT